MATTSIIMATRPLVMAIHEAYENNNVREQIRLGNVLRGVYDGTHVFVMADLLSEDSESDDESDAESVCDEDPQ